MPDSLLSFFLIDRLFFKSLLNLLQYCLCFDFFFFFLAVMHVGSQFPYQGSNLRPLHWKCGILTTGPGKSQDHHFIDRETVAREDSLTCLRLFCEFL